MFLLHEKNNMNKVYLIYIMENILKNIIKVEAID